jgi:hypothetical protein
MQKIALGFAAVTAALTLAACGGSDDAEEPAATPSPPATTDAATTDAATTDAVTTEPVATDAEPAETEPAGTETQPTTTGGGREPDVRAQIEVADGERAGGQRTVRATQGDRVRIEVTVDAAQELHLHGYDISKEATPDTPAVFAFRADLEGIFELESHAGHEVIASVVVEP